MSYLCVLVHQMLPTVSDCRPRGALLARPPCSWDHLLDGLLQTALNSLKWWLRHEGFEEGAAGVEREHRRGSEDRGQILWCASHSVNSFDVRMFASSRAYLQALLMATDIWVKGNASFLPGRAAAYDRLLMRSSEAVLESIQARSQFPTPARRPCQLAAADSPLQFQDDADSPN